jgi:murein DD-endopeptidase MepM/ murein hydrolase activator NlpD
MMGRRPLRWLALLAALLTALALAQESYTVQPGDTLSAIARRYGVTVEALKERNRLSSSLIRPGQTLRIPGNAPSQVPGLPPGFRLHRLEPGDTLTSLAARYGLGEAALLAVNEDLVGEDGSFSGPSLRIPPRPGLLVTLAPGQDLLSLALAYGMAPSDLARANGLEGYKVSPGQRLFIPGHLPEARPVEPEERLATRAPRDARERLQEEVRAELAKAPMYLAAYRPSSRGLIWPLQGVISSGFGSRNLSVAGSTFHLGLDIVSPIGTPILAAQAGVVSRAGWGGHYGYVVYLDHEGGMQTRYAHLNRIDVSVGERVRQGDPLGVVGETGATTGPHLHFEVRISGRAVNPRDYLP